MKNQDYYENTIPKYLPDSFKRFFKVSRETIDILCGHLSHCDELLERVAPGGREPIPLEKKLLMTIRYLASQETVLELSDRFGVTEYSLLKCKRDVIAAVNNNLMTRFITWPENELAEVAGRFNDMGNYDFPDIVGAIDGSHIAIEAPSQYANSYFNRKKFHSVVLQAVCLDDLRFTDINVGWPGRVHDAKVLRNSSLWDTGFQKCAHGRYHLLGDAAYPLREWLLTPYRDNGHLTPQQTRYNIALSSKRQVIERAFSILKGRFRRLKYVNMKSVEDICKAISCACIIHNVCIQQGDELEDRLEDEEPAVGDGVAGVEIMQHDAQGHLKRIRISNAM